MQVFIMHTDFHSAKLINQPISRGANKSTDLKGGEYFSRGADIFQGDKYPLHPPLKETLTHLISSSTS